MQTTSAGVSAQNAVLISASGEDREFWGKVSVAAGIKLQFLSSWQGLERLLISTPESVVLWSLDPDSSLRVPVKDENQSISTIVKTIPPTILALLAANRSVALTTKPIVQYPEYLMQAPFLAQYFHHNLIRHYTPSAETLYPLFLKQLGRVPSGLQPYFLPGAPLQQIVLKSTKHRTAAVEAIQSLLLKKGFEPRLAAKAAQSTDELLMNAIFDAASDKNTGVPIRHHIDRRSQFDFPAHEKVILEVAGTDEYLGVCVTDSFGSLKKDRVSAFLSQNFQNKDYVPRKNSPAAGLGLYGIVQAGLSLIYSCQPGVRTDAILLFPRTTSYRAFKQGFQVLGYFEGKTERKR